MCRGKSGSSQEGRASGHTRGVSGESRGFVPKTPSGDDFWLFLELMDERERPGLRHRDGWRGHGDGEKGDKSRNWRAAAAQSQPATCAECPPVSHSCVPRDTLRGKAGVIPALGVLKLQGKAALSSFPKFCSLPSLDQINLPKDGSGEGRGAGGAGHRRSLAVHGIHGLRVAGWKRSEAGQRRCREAPGMQQMLSPDGRGGPGHALKK